MKEKAFFIIFKGLSVSKNFLRPECTFKRNSPSSYNQSPLFQIIQIIQSLIFFFFLIKNPVSKKITSQWVSYDTHLFINKQPQVIRQLLGILNFLRASLVSPICSQCTLSLPSENIRKPYGFSNKPWKIESSPKNYLHPHGLVSIDCSFSKQNLL